MSSGNPTSSFHESVPVESIGYLHCRVREEADAAVRAASLEATLAHIHLATAFANRIRDYSAAAPSRVGNGWADEHRVW
jgi:hypothetical protein